MSVTYVNAELRRLVQARAAGICEYCLIAEEDILLGCAVDHIISEKHGGLTQADNLAMACVFCNRAKGSDLGSISWETGDLVRFFNPRLDRWSDHFALTGSNIAALTVIGIPAVILDAIRRLSYKSSVNLDRFSAFHWEARRRKGKTV